jgi:hypothetical protein
MYMLYIMVTTCFVSSSTSRPRPRPGTTNWNSWRRDPISS